jgi:hypoxanthine phosphoribosyltransferase
VGLLYDERFGPADIARRIQNIGRRISFDYPEGPIVLIAILKGAGFFVADLARAVSRPVRCEYIDVIRRGDEEEVVTFNFITSFSVEGAHLVILKDVTRSGIIETYLSNQLREERPLSIRFAALADRPQERKSSLLVDYVLFPSEEGVLVGYGMEFQGEGGNFPFIAQVRTEGDAPFDSTLDRLAGKA